jgi:hypothetical protein
LLSYFWPPPVSAEDNANYVSRNSPNRCSPNTLRRRFSASSAVERIHRNAWQPRGVQANFGKNGNALIAVDPTAGHCDGQ